MSVNTHVPDPARAGPPVVSTTAPPAALVAHVDPLHSWCHPRSFLTYQPHLCASLPKAATDSQTIVPLTQTTVDCLYHCARDPHGAAGPNGRVSLLSGLLWVSSLLILLSIIHNFALVGVKAQRPHPEASHIPHNRPRKTTVHERPYFWRADSHGL